MRRQTIGALPAGVLLWCVGAVGCNDPSGGEGGSAEGSDGTAATDTDASGDDDGSGDAGSDDGDPGREPTDPDQTWQWDLPPGFPEPYVPADNPMTAAKVELGRYLFYDTRLSVNGTTSCGTCHQQQYAFTDGRAQAVGATGQSHTRGSMSLANVVYASTLGWGNPELYDLEEQALGPLFGVQPIEMGLVDEADVVARISDDPVYVELFERAYPDDAQPMTLDHITGSIASFERTLISGNSPFDRWFYGGDESAVSESAKRGYDFIHFPGECFYCHFSFGWTDAVYFAELPERTTKFHNIALYNLDEDGSYPEGNTGVHSYTGQASDMGRFKSPTLRNITVTAPYMHDGSAATLRDVLEHYAAGGRTIEDGPHAGVGADNPHKSVFMRDFSLKEEDVEDAMALFEALRDDEFLTNPAFADPWAE